jgi:ubiquinone/menaquinone biosynthesis C-methylase UbiE
MRYSLGMSLDDRFDALIESLAGFHRTWVAYLGLELGLLERVRASGDDGISPEALADACECAREPVRVWAIAADAHEIASFDGLRVRLDPETAEILLDEDRPEYLGGQFIHTVVASLDHDGLARVFRTGRPVTARPDRYRASIERLTRQDVAVFFQEALAALPDLVAALARGIRVADVHCGGGRWLIAVARRFPGSRLVGVEFEPDSVERARRSVEAAGVADRVEIVQADLARSDEGLGRFDLVYFQYALHRVPEATDALRAGWRMLAPGGQLVVQDWCAPTDLEDARTQHGRLIAGIQLDEVFQGSRLPTVEELRSMMAEARVPDPLVVDLPSGATLLVAHRPG